MAINIFEGGRRIVKIIAWILAITMFLYIYALTGDNPQAIHKLMLFILGSCFAILWVGSYLIGWIVRGFMGIPRGQDKK